MRFQYVIHADDMNELRAALSAMLLAIPADVFAGKARGFSIHVDPEYDALAAAMATAPADAAAEPPADAEPVPAKKPRGRPRKDAVAPAAQQAERIPPADMSPAPIDTPAEPDANDPDDDAYDLAYEESAELADTDDEEAAAPAPGVPAPGPAESKLIALDVLMNVWGRPGGAEEIRAIQARYGVKKMAEVPDSEGHKLLADADAALGRVSTGAFA